MCRTRAPPSTAFVAASIWSGTGEVKTAPGQAASSMPRPTKPPCIGSWPEPPPEITPTLPWRGASARTTTFGSMTFSRSPCAAAMPASASSTTASAALMSFFIASSHSQGVREQRGVGDCTDRAADERANHRNPRVLPVGRSLARDRQDRVGDARTEVTRGIDRISGRAAQREADGEDQEPNDERRDGRRRATDGEDAKDQHEGADDLADQVRGRVANRRAGAEDGQLEAGIVGGRPVRQVVEPDEDRADERAKELAAEIERDGVPSDSAGIRSANGERQRHGRVDVGSADRSDGIDRDRDRETPSEGDHDPAGVLCLRSREEDAGDDAVAKDDEYRRADRLGQEFVHGSNSLRCELPAPSLAPDLCAVARRARPHPQV